METQWGKNPEYTLSAHTQPKFLALPFTVSWHNSKSQDHRFFCVSVHFLCFSIYFEIWETKNG